jgi:catechol 2,3-dioxygenase-like lactoylglutathione lyase family enzyme
MRGAAAGASRATRASRWFRIGVPRGCRAGIRWPAPGELVLHLAPTRDEARRERTPPHRHRPPARPNRSSPPDYKAAQGGNGLPGCRRIVGRIAPLPRLNRMSVEVRLRLSTRGVTVSIETPPDRRFWPHHLRPGALRFARSSSNYDQTIPFYRDVLGLPVVGEFADSFGEDGTIFGLPDTHVQLEIVRARGGVTAADPLDMLVLYLPGAAAVAAATAPLRTARVPKDPTPHPVLGCARRDRASGPRWPPRGLRAVGLRGRARTRRLTRPAHWTGRSCALTMMGLWQRVSRVPMDRVAPRTQRSRSSPTFSAHNRARSSRTTRSLPGPVRPRFPLPAPPTGDSEPRHRGDCWRRTLIVAASAPVRPCPRPAPPLVRSSADPHRPRPPQPDTAVGPGTAVSRR